MLKILRNIAAIAAAVILVAARSVRAAVVEVPRLAIAAAQLAGEAAWSILVGPPMRSADPAQPVVPLIRAQAFSERMGRRDRPVISTRWRMCPSC